MDSLKYWFFAMYGVTILVAIGIASWSIAKREKKIAHLQTDLKKKLTAKFVLSGKDVVLFGRSYNLSPQNSRLALYRVYKDIESAEEFEELKKLVQDIQKEEPFDTMPDEVKPSLLRLSELADQSKSDSDRHILTPITNILTKYQELLEEQKKTRKQANIAYMFTIVSFVVGSVSLYYAISAPTASEIAIQLQSMLK
ncbi:hypothetical protein [Vibrio cholerae]|uniref:hypothetical protein n=1 Tax=Vibrio cholerae TaxID=666 RepID=UPI001E4E0C18|nr:hypothetical protein [Vibrio cholerae]EHS7465863.1 hypothetical protein [Vibrio cholerae]EII3003710.1 hypothetical protein [Vibrio cholerae]EJL6274924.1 hypothetical protein [Vibrio cholerae]EJX1709414.1 hypothetical protein [Vibrio cholerae]EKF9596075.1 hypothetical protein [Vibrio cholerae]